MTRTGRPRGTGHLKPDAERKTCPRCRRAKPVDQFGKNKNTADGLYWYCNRCVRDRWLRATYGIDLDHYEDLVAEQDGRCPICQDALQDGKRVAVDHDHATGRIRGVLCVSCNLGLGHFRDSPMYLSAAIDYIRRTEDNVAKDMRKKCLHCGQPELLAMVTINKAVPLADRNGTIKLSGQKIGQIDLKNAWDKIGGLETGPDQMLRGPILCGNCETEHFWVVGDKKNPLRIGSVVEARKLGYEALLTK